MGGVGNDTLTGGAGLTTLWRAGNDIVNYEDYLGDLLIDLRSHLQDINLKSKLIVSLDLRESPGSGDDILIGNDDDTRLDGGTGTNHLLGGGGSDNFVIHWDETSVTTISDFYSVAGQDDHDTIDISRWGNIVDYRQLHMAYEGLGDRLSILTSNAGQQIRLSGFRYEYLSTTFYIHTTEHIGENTALSASDDVISGTNNGDQINSGDGFDYIDAQAGADDFWWCWK